MAPRLPFFLFFYLRMKADPTELKRKRGRPTNAARWLSLPEVAEILRCDVGMLERLLRRLPEALPGAICEADGWQVPERALRVLLGSPCGPLPQMCSVEDVAVALRKDAKTVYGWLRLRKAGAEGGFLLPHRRVLGSIRVDVRDVLSLPAAMPGPRSSFFADREAARGL